MAKRSYTQADKALLIVDLLRTASWIDDMSGRYANIHDMLDLGASVDVCRKKCQLIDQLIVEINAHLDEAEQIPPTTEEALNSVIAERIAFD